jgi:hypothetical protein
MSEQTETAPFKPGERLFWRESPYDSIVEFVAYAPEGLAVVKYFGAVSLQSYERTIPASQLRRPAW